MNQVYKYILNFYQRYRPQLLILTPLLLVTLNLFLKLIYISSNSLGGDEPFSVYHAQMPVKSIIHHLLQGNNPPLYEILLHYWLHLFGISEFSVRLPSVIFSALTVLVVYKTGQKFFSFKTGLVASLLFTFSNVNLQLAHEARVYSLFVLLTVILMYLFLKFISNAKSKWLLGGLLFTNLTLIYAHYFGFFVIAIQFLSVLVYKEVRQNVFKSYLILILGVLVLFSPLLSVLIRQFWVSTVNGTWLTPPKGVSSLYFMIRTFSNQPVTAVVAIILVVAYFGLQIRKTNHTPQPVIQKIILVWFLFPFLCMFGISFWIPMFFDRYLLFITPGFYLLLSVICFKIMRNEQRNFIISFVLIVLFAGTFNPNIDNKRHVRETVAKIKELKTENTAVILCPLYFSLNFMYYYDRTIFKNYDPDSVYNKPLKLLKQQQIYPVFNITDVTITTPKVIYLDAAADFNCPGNNILPKLNTDYKLVNTYKYYKIFNVYEFERK